MKNKAKEESIKRRSRGAFILLAVLMIPVSFLTIWVGTRLARDREDVRNRQNAEAIRAFVANENEMHRLAVQAFDKRLAAHMQMMTRTLGALTGDQGYAGPWVLADGFVVQLQGDGVVLPEGMPKGTGDLSRAMIDQSLSSGKMRTGRYVISGETSPDVPGGEGLKQGAYLTSFAQIGEDLVYVNLISRDMLDVTVDSYIRRNSAAVDNANDGYDGVTLVVSGQAEGTALLKAYPAADAKAELSDYGFTPEMVLQRADVAVLQGKAYRCYYSSIENTWDGRDRAVLIQMFPALDAGMHSIVQAVIICYVLLLILVNIIVYVVSVQRYVREKTMTEEQAARYRPRRLRVRMANAAVIGVAAVLLSALVVQGVEQLYTELRYGRETLSVLLRQMEQVSQDQSQTLQGIEESWYVYSGTQMASLISAYPELSTPQTLQSSCDSLDVDFIMLFDSRGNETLCNRDYAGFRLDKGLGPDGADFNRLLYGVPGIVHEASVDAVTGMERQMIGVKLPKADEEDRHGALIMALLPEKTRPSVNTLPANVVLELLQANGSLCFSADVTTGRILEASDKTMTGLTLEACGLNEKALGDGYMDFTVVNGVNRFILSSRQDDMVYYYAREFRRMLVRVTMHAGLSAGLYALAALIILLYVFRGYDEEVYARWAVVCMPGEEAQKGEERQQLSEGAPEKQQKGLFRRVAQLIQRLSDAFQWSNRTPEQKTALVFRVSLLVLMVFWANLLLSKNMVYKRYDSLAGFLLQGDWMRGVNLFSFCSILLVTGYAYLINLLSHGILLLISGFLLGKGKTFCRLIHSFIKYFSAFVVIYLVLLYLGFPVSTVVGSLSITTLALSLGARDLAADILAGLSIVFEQTFQVGDIVEINGKRGKVQEIGMRATKLIVPVNNVLVINNHDIRDVLNLTQDVSMYTMELRILPPKSLRDLEALLKRELLKIQKRNDKIISLSYMGVTSLGSSLDTSSFSTITLGIGAYCRQDDMYDVTMYLNREIRLLYERENITQA